MSSLGNDGSLIGFWPMNEPSGSPLFQNYAPATAKHPSGLSFDMLPHVVNVGDDEHYGSVWPGTDQIFNQESGVDVRGYRVQGHWELLDNANPRAWCLLAGDGSRVHREQFASPPVANSGFTAGFWVYPTSDGYPNFVDDVSNILLVGWEQQSALAHAIYGMFGYDTNEAGWVMGVSGKLEAATQFEGELEGGEPLLRAFLVGVNDGTALEAGLGTPIESGRYSHMTMTYTYIDGTNNEMRLYKDGRLEGTAITPFDYVNGGSTSFTNRTLTIGGTVDNVTANDEYLLTSGWGHLVSGVYFFRRPLSDSEVLDLHQCGGLQPDITNILETKEVTTSDSKLLAYCPFDGIGYADASRNFNVLMEQYDPGDEGAAIISTGPFGGGSRVQNAANVSDSVVAGSGLCSAIVDAGSWSIGVWATAKNTPDRDDNMVMSWGSVSTTTSAGTALAAISNATFGFSVTSREVPTNSNRIRLEVYPVGDVSEDFFEINASGFDPFTRVMRHYGVVYDDQTRGIAFYINGALQGSGNLTHSLNDQLTRLVGSGYPLMFTNGITNTITETAGKGVHTAGGSDNAISQIMVMGRPLEPSEMRFIALSGIDTKAFRLSPFDTRLQGYWPCSDHEDGDILTEDRARIWDDYPGHLARGDTFVKWSRIYNRAGSVADQQIYRPDATAFVDLYGARTTPPELASFGNLGITSGVWAVRGGGMGVAEKTNSADSRSSRFNLAVRYKPNIEERDVNPQNVLGEYIMSFEVTPSGDIPAIDFGQSSNANKFEFNSCIYNYGNLGESSQHGETRAFLTTVNEAQGSGVSIVFQSRAGTFNASNTRMLGSGNLTYGVPNRVLLHGKYTDPYSRTTNFPGFGSALYTLTLYIDGVEVHQVTDTTTSLLFWEAGTPNSDDDHYILSFGGEACTDSVSLQLSQHDAGLGDIYLREMFVMRGRFTGEEVLELATSGIRNQGVFGGYIGQKPKNQVTLIDSDLRGYWRFNGFDGGPAHGVQGSGTTDLSPASNHLLPLAEIDAQRGTNTTSAHFLRFAPGPLVSSDLGVRCSGVTYESNQPSSFIRAPFMASGVGISNPAGGFSVGFLMAKRDDVFSNRFDAVLAYGCVPTASAGSTATSLDHGWVIGMDSAENMKMVMSQDGHLFLNNANSPSQSGQVACGGFESNRIDGDNTIYENAFTGDTRVPRLDFWSHYAWTYDPADNTIRCYINGELVDRKPLKTAPEFWDGPQEPREEARYLTFFAHTTTPWLWSTPNVGDFDSVLSDVFYFSRTLSESEVRYIAFNGIDDAQGTATSGNIGGYIRGQDTGSGVIGGYQRGQDTASGVVGGYMPGGLVGSGLIGGYVSGVVFGTGTIGGWIRGLDNVSGVMGGYMVGVDIGSGSIAGYIRGQEVGSGHFGGLILAGNAASGLVGGYLQAADIGSGLAGGFMLGGLQGNFEFDAGFNVDVIAARDFDAQLEIAKTTSADFDAKVVIFQNELPPLVDITIPSDTVTMDENGNGLEPPFNQYFIGKASGQQGKTIATTKWTFGDLTPNETVAESGAGCYPIQHLYSASGFYIAKFEAVDSDGLHASATRIINAASGIDPVIVSLSGVPRSGDAELIVDFTTTVDILPPGVSISTQLLNYDDGQSTVSFNPTHGYTQPGTYKPIWCVRDSRGVIWCDSLEAGNDYLGA